MRRRTCRQALSMFSFLPALTIFAGGLLAQEGSADLDELKKKVAELEEKLSGGLTAGIGKRPYIQSADGKHKLEFGGRIQARYTYQGRDVRGAGEGDGSDRSWGELERARARVQGTLFDERFSFLSEWDGHSDEGTLELTDMYIQYKHAAHLAIGAGQWKPYFGRQEKQSSAQQLLVDRSLANEYFNIDRNVGVWVEGRKEYSKEGLFNAVGYEAAVTNGIDSVNQGLGSGEIDQIPAFVAHVDLDVMGNLGSYALTAGDLRRSKDPGLTVGASFVSDQNNGSGGADEAFVEYRLYQMAYDFVYKQMGFSLNGEYFGRWLDFEAADVNNEGGDDGSAIYSHGGYVEAGYMLTDKLQVVGRTSTVWNQEGPATGNAFEAGGGLNYFFNDHNLKLSLDVLYLDIPADMITMTEKLPGLGGSADDLFDDDLDPGTPDIRRDFRHGSLSSSSANLDEMQGVMVRTQLQLYF